MGSVYPLCPFLPPTRPFVIPEFLFLEEMKTQHDNLRIFSTVANSTIEYTDPI